MKKLPLVRWQYSGAHHDVVKGIGLTTLLWTQDGSTDHIPVEYYGTSNTNLTAADVERIYGKRWQIEEYHRGLKQQCGLAKCQARTSHSQRNHIWCAIHAFVILELHRKKTGTTWQEAKRSIARQAVQRYLLNPRYGMVMASA
jgi:hypothetical protein